MRQEEKEQNFNIFRLLFNIFSCLSTSFDFFSLERIVLEQTSLGLPNFREVHKSVLSNVLEPGHEHRPYGGLAPRYVTKSKMTLEEETSF